jgi:PAS domain S-box-containing protein
MLGYSHEELLLMNTSDMIYPDDRPDFLNSSHDVLTGAASSYTAERRYVRKDGSLFFGRVIVQAVHNLDGELKYRIAMFEDVTGRKHAEDALRESEARYRTMVEQQTDCVCRWIPDATLTFVNQAYCSFLGKKPEELLGHKWLDFVPSEMQTACREHVAAVATSLKTIRFAQ